MEQKGNKVDIPLLGIARSGSDRTCVDGKCNEVVGMEYKDGSYYPYAPTEYTKTNIEGAERVWIHKTSLQSNWLKLEKGKIYWTKENTDEWENIGFISNFDKDTPIDFAGNLIALGNAIYFLFRKDKYIRFTRDDLSLTLDFHLTQNRVYGIRSRYRWDTLAGMEKTQSKGFAETICGLYNKLDNKAVEENKLTGACYMRYAFRLYDGSYINASVPILLKNFDYEKQYYDFTSGLVSYNYKDKQYATPLFGTIYGGAIGCGEFGGANSIITAGVSNLPSGAGSSAPLYFCGLRREDKDVFYGSYSVGRYDYQLNARLEKDIYRDYCSKVYKNLPYSDNNGAFISSNEGNKNVKPVDEVIAFDDEINHLNTRNFNTEEMSCISCIADSAWGTEGAHDWCDVYAFKKASTINIRKSGVLKSELKDLILSVDVFMTRPILPVESDKQETLDDFQCVEHRKIKDKKAFLSELQTSQRAFYKVLEIPVEDLIDTSKKNYTDADFDNEAIKNITAKEELVTYSNHTMRYNICYNYNQKLHIADFTYTLYNGQMYQLADRNMTSAVWDAIRAYVYVQIDGREYITEAIPMNGNIGLHSCFYYPDARATKVLIKARKAGTREFYTKEFTLKASDVSDFAYFETENGKSILHDVDKWGITTEDEHPIINNVVHNAINNVMRVSDNSNPLVFPYTYSYQIGNGSIVGFSSNAQALSQGQFGEHKLFVFTTDGIWAMKNDATGKFTYVDQDPVSREVCNNKKSICQIDGGVVFSSEKGLMIISGKDPSILSEELNGMPIELDNRVYRTSISNIKLVLLDKVLSDMDFKEYLSLEDTFVTYLYKKDKLIIYNGLRSYCYFMDIKTKVTTKLAYCFNYAISDYPNDKLVSGHTIYEFPINSNKEFIDTLIQTRPIKVGSHESKSAYRAVIRGEFSTIQKEPIGVRYLNINNIKPISSEVEIIGGERIEITQIQTQDLTLTTRYGTRRKLFFRNVYLNTICAKNRNKTLTTYNQDADGNPILTDGISEVTYNVEDTNDSNVMRISPVLESYNVTNKDGKLRLSFVLKRHNNVNTELVNCLFVFTDSEGNKYQYQDNKTYQDTGATYEVLTDIDYVNVTEVSIDEYDDYKITSISFYTGVNHRVFVPYVDENNTLQQRVYEVYVRDDVDEKKIKLYIDDDDAFNFSTVYAYNRNIYDNDNALNYYDVFSWACFLCINYEKEYTREAGMWLFKGFYTLHIAKDYYNSDANVETVNIDYGTFVPNRYYTMDEIRGMGSSSISYPTITIKKDTNYHIKYTPDVIDVTFSLDSQGRVFPELLTLMGTAKYRVTLLDGTEYTFHDVRWGDVSEDVYYEDLEAMLKSGDNTLFKYTVLYLEASINTSFLSADYIFGVCNLNTDKRNWESWLQNPNYFVAPYTPSELSLVNGKGYVIVVNGISYPILYKGDSVISSELLLSNIANYVYDDYEEVTDVTVIRGLFGNVKVIDGILGVTYEFYSNYESGEATYGELRKDYEGGLLEPVRDLDYDRELSINNGTYVHVSYNDLEYNIIYTGISVIRLRDFIDKLNSYKQYNPTSELSKYIGFYVYGSIDGNTWGFIGGSERIGKGLTDILTKTEHLSMKYIKLVFVGNISHDSHIDGIELQASNKYDNKIR